MPDVVIVGAGIVGAACAYFAAQAGLSVTVVDRAGVAGGTTGAGEGNILVSDKPPGPELDLALRSIALWRSLPITDIELEAKGGLVVSATPESLRPTARAHRAAGVVCELVAPRDLEPHLSPALAGGLYYPQDMQVQPMLAAARLLRASGAKLELGRTVTGFGAGRVHTTHGDLHAAAIVNATGVWAGRLGAGPVQPRRGFILVTSRQPRLVRHKVYAGDYGASVGSDSAELRVAPVVEGTMAGNVLIGSSRERVGFDQTMSLPALRLLAAGAIRLFPRLAAVQVIRAYRGFRPFTPDHLPIIGPDPLVPGLWHACGHEGAGVGLAPATGKAIADQIVSAVPDMDYAPFAPGRFS